MACRCTAQWLRRLWAHLLDITEVNGEKPSQDHALPAWGRRRGALNYRYRCLPDWIEEFDQMICSDNMCSSQACRNAMLPITRAGPITKCYQHRSVGSFTHVALYLELPGEAADVPSHMDTPLTPPSPPGGLLPSPLPSIPLPTLHRWLRRRQLPAGPLRPAPAPPPAPARRPSCTPEEQSMCVICPSLPPSAGFLHGSTVHRCVTHAAGRSPSGAHAPCAGRRWSKCSKCGVRPTCTQPVPGRRGSRLSAPSGRPSAHQLRPLPPEGRPVAPPACHARSMPKNSVSEE